MRQFLPSSEAAKQDELGDVDLEQAADIFLHGPLRSGRMDVAIGDRAVGQVARTLSRCSTASIHEIKHAVTLFRGDPSLGTRDAVIEEVARAAAELQTTRKER